MLPLSAQGNPSSQIRRGAQAILLLAFLFYLNFLSRILFSPLLPSIKTEFVLNNGQSGALFLVISTGYFISILLSGFVAVRLNHENTIWFSSVGCGIILLFLYFCNSIELLYFGLFCLGLTAGLYLPSGISTIIGSLPTAYLARGMAIHELAPNLGFVSAPLLCELAAGSLNWRELLLVLGVALILVGTLYKKSGFGSQERGVQPDGNILCELLRQKRFWLLVFLFTFGICSTLGIYAMLPLFLVSNHQMTIEQANNYTAFSRVVSVFAPLLGGWLGDRFGNARVMIFVLIIGGISTLLMSLYSGPVLLFLIFFQPVIAVCFFPSGFVVLSGIRVGELQNVAISFCIPIAFLLGGGVIPVIIGVIGDITSIGTGIGIVGAAILLAGCFGAWKLEE